MTDSSAEPRQRSLRNDDCPACGYDLSRTPGDTCPECGCDRREEYFCTHCDYDLTSIVTNVHDLVCPECGNAVIITDCAVGPQRFRDYRKFMLWRRLYVAVALLSSAGLAAGAVLQPATVWWRVSSSSRAGQASIAFMLAVAVCGLGSILPACMPLLYRRALRSRLRVAYLAAAFWTCTPLAVAAAMVLLSAWMGPEVVVPSAAFVLIGYPLVFVPSGAALSYFLLAYPTPPRSGIAPLAGLLGFLVMWVLGGVSAMFAFVLATH